MIEIKPRYRVRLENALTHSGHCAIETVVEASSIVELQDNVEAFMNSLGIRSNEFEIARPAVHGFGRDVYLVGLHWRIEDVTRED